MTEVVADSGTQAGTAVHTVAVVPRGGGAVVTSDGTPTAGPRAAGGKRVTALDGLRGASLLIIMGYHFGVGWLQGGFFGLDIFYVLSGFLITGLLLAEFRRSRRIVLSAFWLRRARRLLPALLIVLVAVSLCVRFIAQPGTYPDFRISALSALFFFSNWWQIASTSSYFVVTGAVSPLTHTWSLAVEEQFYIVWPLLVLAVMKLGRTFARGLRVLLVVSSVGAVASALEMVVLDSPTVNATRLYFGTDTHAQSILVGAAMACALTMIQLRRGTGGIAPRATSTVVRCLLVGLGVAGFAVIVVMTCTLTGTSAIDYQGGFTVSALASAVVILGAICVPDGPIAWVLSVRPLAWLGTISYGAYLWHFPVYVFVNPARAGISGLPLVALRFACTVVLAAASFYLVERPVMYGTFWRSLKAILPAGALTLATVGVIFVATDVAATAAPTVTQFGGSGQAQGSGTDTDPPKVVVLGDSTSLTLGYALAATAPTGTAVVNGGLFGCGLAIGTSSSDHPPTPGLPMFPACNSSAPSRQRWPARDTATVAGTGPGDVVLFVAGEWETHDLLIGGHWTNILAPSFQHYESDQLRTLIEIGTAHGAHLDLFTMPAEDGAMQTGVASIDSDSPTRRAIYNGLLSKAAAEFPGKVSIVDYGRILSPNGVFTEYLNGVQVRTIDGVHTPSYAPGNIYVGNSSQAVAQAFDNWISPKLWPLIIDSVPGPAPSHGKS